MARNDDEREHDEAVRVLRAEYYQDVRDMVGNAMEEIRAGNITDREGFDEHINQSVDDSYWVIYTHANKQVIFVSDNDDAYVDEFGEAPVEGGDINWAAMAFAAMQRDVYDAVDDDEVDALLEGDEDDEDE